MESFDWIDGAAESARQRPGSREILQICAAGFAVVCDPTCRCTFLFHLRRIISDNVMTKFLLLYVARTSRPRELCGREARETVQKVKNCRELVGARASCPQYAHRTIRFCGLEVRAPIDFWTVFPLMKGERSHVGSRLRKGYNRTSMKAKQLILRIFIVALIGAGIWVANLIWFRPWNINHFYERAFIEFAFKTPELLSSLGLLDSTGLDFYNDELNNASDKFQHEMNALVRKDLEVLAEYDRSKQNTSQLLSTDILAWFLNNMVEGQKYMYHNYPLNQLSGEQSELPSFMDAIHRVENKGDAEDYITRLSKFGVRFDQVLEGVSIREKKGIIPPRFVVEKVLDQMKNFVSQDARSNILYVSFEKKLEKTKEINGTDKQELLKQAEEQISKTVYPAYNRMIEKFTQLKNVTTTDDGVWKLPDGDAFYSYALHSQTTTNMDPSQIHELGLSEVKRIQDEMRVILDGLGVTGKSVSEHLQDLAKDPRFLYPSTDEGRKQCLADYQAIIDEIDRGISSAFDIRPKSGVRVERVPEFKEKTESGAYYNAPSMDGSRPGMFYANLRDMSELPKWGMRTLSYHEAIPGHHFQIAIQMGLQGVPMFRKIIPFTAYSEGWALYAERLAWEMGFQKDPYTNLGRLQAELFRAVRLVVDTGIHRKRWTREQAIRYMLDNTGMAEGEVTAEIERYIVNPGQACAYKVGQLKILELREKAKKAMGDKFKLQDFHNVVLQNGAMPLDILEAQVDQYIKGS